MADFDSSQALTGGDALSSSSPPGRLVLLASQPAGSSSMVHRALHVDHVSDGGEGMTEADKTFHEELSKFLESQCPPITLNTPHFSKKPLNLYRLYRRVMERGGYELVTKTKLWKPIAREMGASDSMTSASTTLRLKYEKYIYLYEMIHGVHIPPSVAQQRLEDVRRARRNSHAEWPTGDAATDSAAPHVRSDDDVLGLSDVLPARRGRDECVAFEHIRGETLSLKRRKVFEGVAQSLISQRITESSAAWDLLVTVATALGHSASDIEAVRDVLSREWIVTVEHLESLDSDGIRSLGLPLLLRQAVEYVLSAQPWSVSG